MNLQSFSLKMYACFDIWFCLDDCSSADWNIFQTVKQNMVVILLFFFLYQLHGSLYFFWSQWDSMVCDVEISTQWYPAGQPWWPGGQCDSPYAIYLLPPSPLPPSPRFWRHWGMDITMNLMFSQICSSSRVFWFLKLARFFSVFLGSLCWYG